MNCLYWSCARSCLGPNFCFVWWESFYRAPVASKNNIKIYKRIYCFVRSNWITASSTVPRHSVRIVFRKNKYIFFKSCVLFCLYLCHLYAIEFYISIKCIQCVSYMFKHLQHMKKFMAFDLWTPPVMKRNYACGTKSQIFGLIPWKVTYFDCWRSFGSLLQSLNYFNRLPKNRKIRIQK